MVSAPLSVQGKQVHSRESWGVLTEQEAGDRFRESNVSYISLLIHHPQKNGVNSGIVNLIWPVKNLQIHRHIQSYIWNTQEHAVIHLIWPVKNLRMHRHIVYLKYRGAYSHTSQTHRRIQSYTSYTQAHTVIHLIWRVNTYKYKGACSHTPHMAG